MKLIDRHQYIKQLARVANTPEIKIITGVRRSGKSKLLTAFSKHILSENPEANIISIDFTMLRFEQLKDYHALNDFIESRYKAGVDNYVMIDEVQLCPNFELTINSLHSEEKYDIYLTGSNAFLLSSDLATLFTGRHIEIHVYPFSFREYCTYFNEEKDIQNNFDRYMMLGGFAGSYPYSSDNDKEKYIRDVYNTILLRDLVEKFRLGNETALKRIGNYLMDNVSNISSSRNISNGLNANGMETNHKTVGSYIQYLCNAFYSMRLKDMM